jgi:hypothetical protein
VNDTRGVARLNACRTRYAGLWLYGSVFTTGPKLWLSNAELSTAVRLRLGIPIAADPRPCVLCAGAAVSDVLGDHTLSCLHGGHKTLLHSRVLDVVYGLARNAQLQPQREPHPFVSHRLVRPDIAIRPAGANNVTLLGDVTVTHPLARYHIEARRVALGAAREYVAAEKVAKYAPFLAAHQQLQQSAAGAAQQLLFLPLAADMLGGVADDFASFVKRLAKAWGLRFGLPDSTAVRIAFHRVAFVLVAGAARIANINAAATVAQI